MNGLPGSWAGIATRSRSAPSTLGRHSELTAAKGQLSVFGSEPGESDYNPLWEEFFVTWKPGVTPVLLVKDDQVKSLAKSTFTPGVLSDIGSFGGLFALDRGRHKEPVLVASTSSVASTSMSLHFVKHAS